MSALTKLTTGVPGLDVLTLGGIPQGRSTLITGKSGTGKTVGGRRHCCAVAGSTWSMRLQRRSRRR